jgi:hypothetical protein
MRLHFEAALVERLLHHSGAAQSRKSPCGTCSPTHGAGLWLVGDHGIYLMSNGVPGLLAGDGPRHVVAHAAEADPHLQPDTFYAVKRKASGGDDSITFLPESWVLGLLAQSSDGRVCIDLVPGRARIASAARRARQAGKAAPLLQQKKQPDEDAAALLQNLLAALGPPPKDREARRRRRILIRTALYSVLLAAKVRNDAAEAALNQLSDALGYTIVAPRSSFRLRQDAWELVTYLSTLRGINPHAAEVSNIAAILTDARARLWSRSRARQSRPVRGKAGPAAGDEAQDHG